MLKLKSFVALLAVLAIVLGTQSIVFAQNVSVNGIRIWHAPDHTRIVFDLSNKVEYEVSQLAEPNRYVVDFRQVSLTGEIPVNQPNLRIQQLRAGQLDSNQFRVVIPALKSFNVRSFQLEPNELYGHRLVIDLYDLQAGQKPQIVKEKDDDSDSGNNRVSTTSAVKEPIISSTPTASPPTSTNTTNTINNNALKREVVIAVDAGHGGEDPGALGSRSQEKNVTLAISRRLARLINNTPKMKAVLIRDNDYFVRLRNRTAKARQVNADLFVSIHADAALNKSARGMSVYALSQRGASSELARALARKENQADLVGGVSIRDKDDGLAQVLLDLSLTNKISESVELGGLVLNRLSKLGRLHSKRVEQAGFVVLKSPDIPSILVETGFITNRQDESRLITSGFQQQLAQQIYSGIVDYINKNPVQVANANFQITPSMHTISDFPDIPEVEVSPTINYHTVRTGDSLSKIAERYGITLRQLKQWNNLKSNVAVKGKRLRVSSPSAVASSTAASTSTVQYTVKRGDTLSTIAERYGVTMRSIRQRNNLKSSTVFIGQKLKITSTASNIQVVAQKPTVHVVKRGEFLSSISKKYNISINALKQLNGLTSNKIYVGQKLKLTSSSQTVSQSTSTQASKPTVHTVKRGEFLGSIAEEYNVSIATLKKLNGLKSNNIYVGQKLKLTNTGSSSNTSSNTNNAVISGNSIHTVRSGEYLSGISERYNISIKALKEINGLKSNNIFVGQKLKVSTNSNTSTNSIKTITHTVRSGESLSGIALKYGVKLADIKRWNNLKKNSLLIGQKLTIKTNK